MVHLYKDYYVDADDCQMKLVKRSVSGKSGAEYYTAVGYYTKFENLFNRLIEQCGRDAVMDENVKTVQDILLKMNEVKNYLMRVFSEVEVKIEEDKKKIVEDGEEEH